MDMKIVSLFIACFISMVVAQGPRGWGRPPQGGPGGPGGLGGPPPGGPGGPGGWGRPPPGGPGGPPGGPRGPPPSMLPNCTDFENKIDEAMHEMMQNGTGGPDNCKSGDHHTCRFDDMMAAKKAKNIVPSPECSEEADQLYGQQGN